MLGNELGDLEVKMIVRFLDANGVSTFVDGDSLALSNAANGTFVPYESVIVVPAGADRIKELRIRIDQKQSGGAAQQSLYLDDVTVVGE